MIHMSLQQIATATAGRLHRSDGSEEIIGLTIDSRALEPRQLFVALVGEQADGHDYAAAAARAGAAALLVEKAVDVDLPQIIVDDGRAALAQIATAWRHQLSPVIFGITGSNGKTTVKNLLAGILRQAAPTLATRGNYNNELGLPLTLCRLHEQHQYAVLEMGARQRGDIDVLAAIATPRIGLITNAGPAHLETFGSIRGVAEAKGEIYTCLPDDGVAIINADDEYANYWLGLCGQRRVIRFGRGANADVSCDDEGPRCTFQTPRGEFNVTLQLHGAHNVMNALAATAAALAVDIPLPSIAAGLASVGPEPGRLHYRYADGGWLIIDDTYNANPASLYAAIQTLTDEDGQELWLMLGDMGELGEGSRKLHAEIGEAARQMGVDRLYATGHWSEDAVLAFGHGGRHFTDRQSLVSAACADLKKGVRCLVKGSRSAGMEQVVQLLMGDCQRGAN